MEKPSLIIPPKTIRDLINSTALAVAKNGVELEHLISKNDTNEEKFSFLKLKNPYRKYYDTKVIENAKKLINPLKKNSETNKLLEKYKKKENLLKKENFQNKKNYKEFDFATNLNYGLEIFYDDLMKLTAEFVAVNGEDFLNMISIEKKNDEDFFFLKPNNKYFSYFTILIDSYIHLKNFKNIDFEKLNSFSKNENNYILKYCEKKFLEEKSFLKNKKKMIFETGKNVEDFQYDWNNFQIVKVIDFDNKEIFFNSEKIVDENKYRINPEFSFIFDALKKKPKKIIEKKKILEQKKIKNINLPFKIGTVDFEETERLLKKRDKIYEKSDEEFEVVEKPDFL